MYNKLKYIKCSAVRQPRTEFNCTVLKGCQSFERNTNAILENFRTLVLLSAHAGYTADEERLKLSKICNEEHSLLSEEKNITRFVISYHYILLAARRQP